MDKFQEQKTTYTHAFSLPHTSAARLKPPQNKGYE